MLVLLKIHLNYIKDSIFKCFYKEYNRLLYFFKFFSQRIMMESLSLEEEKDIRKFFRLKKETKAIKGRILREY